jgi:hypothetical protein
MAVTIQTSHSSRRDFPFSNLCGALPTVDKCSVQRSLLSKFKLSWLFRIGKEVGR